MIAPYRTIVTIYRRRKKPPPAPAKNSLKKTTKNLKTMEKKDVIKFGFADSLDTSKVLCPPRGATSSRT